MSSNTNTGSSGSTSSLLRNPTSIGDIFFSGSQTVTKGDEVQWILDDTWAFKTTEDCRVSTNASPFVSISAGQTFIIYKRTKEDEKAQNYKGIYIFDRDTIVALAYPQEVTQDIIIQNDNYNDNIVNITNEADKTPVAKITVPRNPVVGSTITLSAIGSYAIAPATIKTYDWTVNGKHLASSKTVQYKIGNTPQEYDFKLIVKDSQNPSKWGNVSAVSKSVPKPTYKDIVQSDTTSLVHTNICDTNWHSGGVDMTFKHEFTGHIESKAGFSIDSRIEGVHVEVAHFINGHKIGTTSHWIDGNSGKITVTSIVKKSGHYKNPVFSYKIKKTQACTGAAKREITIIGTSRQIKVTHRTA